jgi:predicted  nucleic acid-binding Zn ribbon protein
MRIVVIVAQITFNNTKAIKETLIAQAYSLLAAWYKNGQILADNWTIVDGISGLTAYVFIPVEDALSEQYSNKYVREMIQSYTETTDARPSIFMLGSHPESNTVCSCTDRSGYIFFTHYLSLESPIRCSNCFRPVPLYLLPITQDEEYLNILSWMANYKACDTLQMNCTVGERFGEQQLFLHDSSLSIEGRKLCKQLEDRVNRKVYYYLLKHRGRSLSGEKLRRCPDCGQTWILPQSWHGLFDFRCDHCRLLSNIAFSIR